jgi:hypothetical protein
VLIPNDFGDYFLSCQRRERMEPKALLLVLRRNDSPAFPNYVQQDARVALQQDATHPIADFPNHVIDALSVCQDTKIFVRISAHAIEAEVGTYDRAEWLGGICLHKGRRLYLRGHLPHSVRIGSEVFALNSARAINGVSASHDRMATEIEQHVDEVAFRLTFANKMSTSLVVSRAVKEPIEESGYPLQRSGRFLPQAQGVAKGRPALRGFRVTPEYADRDHALRVWSAAIRTLGERGAIDDPSVRAIILRSDSGVSRLPDAVKRILKS